MLRTVKHVRRGLSIAAMFTAAELVRFVGRRWVAPKSARSGGGARVPNDRATPPVARAASSPVAPARAVGDSPMNRGGAIPDDHCDDPFDAACVQSFPASDPPSWSPR